MRVIFTGDPTEIERAEGLSRVSTELYGVKFPMSVEVDVSHLPLKLQQKLMHNPHFRVAGIDAPAAPLILPRTEPTELLAGDDDEAAEAAPAVKRKAKG